MRLKAVLLLGVLVASPGLAQEVDGRSAYVLHCSGCHRQDGTGLIAKGVPPFPGVIDKILSHPMGRTYLVNTGGVRTSAISHDERAAILNWMIAVWVPEGSQADTRPFDPAEISLLFESWRGDSAKLRRQIREDLIRSNVDIGPIRLE